MPRFLKIPLKRQLPQTPTTSDTDIEPAPDPDHAWKTLSLMNEWIRHSDSKAGVTLAFAGALATMVFTLAKDFTSRTWIFDTLVVLDCVLLVLTGVLCGWTLTPRIHDKEANPEVANRLFFVSISHNFKRENYRQALRELISNPTELSNDLADQIHANAQIATTKAKWAKWAIRVALGAASGVAALAVVIGIANS